MTDRHTGTHRGTASSETAVATVAEAE